MEKASKIPCFDVVESQDVMPCAEPPAVDASASYTTPERPESLRPEVPFSAEKTSACKRQLLLDGGLAAPVRKRLRQLHSSELPDLDALSNTAIEDQLAADAAAEAAPTGAESSGLREADPAADVKARRWFFSIIFQLSYTHGGNCRPTGI